MHWALEWGPLTAETVNAIKSVLIFVDWPSSVSLLKGRFPTPQAIGRNLLTFIHLQRSVTTLFER